MTAPKSTGQFGAGNPGKPKGAVNKSTAALKEAILLAAEQSGIDGRGKAGLVGYLMRVAEYEPKSFCALLGRVLPLQVTGPGPGGSHIVRPLQHVSTEDLLAAVERLGVKP